MLDVLGFVLCMNDAGRQLGQSSSNRAAHILTQMMIYSLFQLYSLAGVASSCFSVPFVVFRFSIAQYANTGNPPPTWSVIPAGQANQGVQLTFNNGQWGSNNPVVDMQFVCAKGQQPSYKVAHDSNTHWTVTVSADACCPGAAPPASTGGGDDPSGPGSSGGGSGGLSGGWIFVILFLVLSVVYVGGGCLYKHYRVGTQGRESCPNVDFWRDFPSLLKDGCVFFISKCKQACGRGGGSGTKEYSEFK